MRLSILQLLSDRHVLPEPKLPRRRRVAFMRLLHVLVDLGEGHVQVEPEVEQHPRDQHRHYRERRILKVRELHFHGAKLDAPADVAAGRRWLPPDGLPVGGLDVLEVVGRVGVRDVDPLAVDHQRVPHEQVRDVPRELLVDAGGDEGLVGGLVDGTGDVIVLVERGGRVRPLLAVAHVRRDRLVPRLGKRPRAASCHPSHLPLVRGSTHFQPSLLRRPVIDRGGDGRPADVGVGESALEDGGRGREREHDRGEHRELVVEVPGLMDVAGLEGDLEAAHAHAECHAVHLDRVPPRARPVVKAGHAQHLVTALSRVGAALLVGAGVDEERDLDVDLGPPPLPDVPCQRRKPRVSVDHRIGARVRLRDRTEWLCRRVREVVCAHHGEGSDGGDDLVAVERR
eukprot:519669-Hanusia_phi.AAC.2